MKKKIEIFAMIESNEIKKKRGEKRNAELHGIFFQSNSLIFPADLYKSILERVHFFSGKVELGNDDANMIRFIHDCEAACSISFRKRKDRGRMRTSES